MCLQQPSLFFGEFCDRCIVLSGKLAERFRHLPALLRELAGVSSNACLVFTRESPSAGAKTRHDLRSETGEEFYG